MQSEHIPVSVTQAELVEALAWAQAVVDRCAVEDTRSNQAAVTHLTSAIPKVGGFACSRLKNAIAITSVNYICQRSQFCIQKLNSQACAPSERFDVPPCNWYGEHLNM